MRHLALPSHAERRLRRLARALYRLALALPFVAVAAFLAAALAAPLSAAAQSIATPAPEPALEPAPRPKAALVLSGGGARGGAHIGVLRVLEQLHVPVDIIVGTSAGSIVGAAYASGLPLAEIEREMARLNTAVLVHDVDRLEVPLHRKADDAVNYVGPEMGVSAEGISLPKGAVAGVSVEAVLRRITRRQVNQQFDRLPIRFRAVATDLVSAEMVVIDQGSLAMAVRASMAIPAVIDPVQIDGRLLVDGGAVRNLPVDVARRLGADVVIAVNIGTPLRTRDEITSILSVTDQMLRILTQKNVDRSIAELGARDVLISPDLGTISSTDFDRLTEAAGAGEAAARAAAPALSRLAVEPVRYAAWREGLNSIGGANAPVIGEVRVRGNERVNSDVILATMSTRAGEPFDEQTADQDMKRLYARGDFEHVGYALSEEPRIGHVLTADVTEKAWGPNYLRFGFGLSTDLEGDSYFTLLAQHRATWLTANGAEWRNEAQIGRTDRIATEWYQPLTPAQRLFGAAHASIAREPFDVYDNGQRLLRYRRESTSFGLDLGAPLGSVGEVRFGYSRGRVEFLRDTGIIPPSLLIPAADMGGLALRLRADTLDSLRFPRSGFSGDLSLYASRSRLGASDNYTKASLALGAATAFGPHALQFGARAARGLSGDLPDYELFTLGGFMQLSGYKTGELLGRALNFGRLVYSYRVAREGLLEGAYVGTSLEAGRIGDKIGGTDAPSTIYAGSLYFAFDTPLGPVYAAYGVGSGGRRAAYLYLGQP